jgi:signal transduction histidine kinase/CheY-like chemotaxis protein
MRTLISRSFIRRRYMAALGGLALFGLVLIGLAHREATEYGRVAEAYADAQDINREIIRTLVAISRRIVAPDAATDTASRSLLNEVALLEEHITRFTGPDAPFPAEIRAMFEPPRDARRDFAAFVALARDLAGPTASGMRGGDPRFPILLSVAANAVQPALDEISAVLRARNAANMARIAELMVAGLAGLVIGLALIRNEIFLPMERRILEAQAELGRETDRARAAERSKGAFLANMSHEIRTSLNGVNGMAELMSRTSLDAEQTHFVNLMRSSGRALLRVINDVLDFSKIAADEMTLDSTLHDPRRTLIDTAQLFAPMISSGGVDFILDLDPAMPRAALGDPVRLRQVVTNLLQNAAKFTAEGRIVLSTRWAAQTQTLSIEVADTGPGIRRDRLHAVFDEFQQEGAIGAVRHAGTGLGLTIAKRLTQAMGGAIGVESRPGEGSRFWLSVPLAARDAPGEAPPVPAHVRVALRIGEPYLAASVLRILDDAGVIVAERDCDVVIADLRAAGAVSVAAARGLAGRVIVLAPPGRQAAGADAALMTPVDPDALLCALSDAPECRTGVIVARDASATGDGPPVRVLVADDNEVNRIVASGLLEMLGCSVELACDGAEAVGLAFASRPDLILMDVSMPRMNGLEAAAEIRRREAGGPRVPIIALTAHAMAEHRDRCLEAGMDDHLPKPFPPEALAAMLARWAPAASAASHERATA